MAASSAVSMSLEEYLRSTFQPDAEYVDGIIEQRNAGEYDHSRLQMALLFWFHFRDKQCGTRTVQTQRTMFNESNVRVPDISVFSRSLPIEQVFTQPQLIAIEILSPEDRQTRVQKRIADYIAFGIPHIWILDPKERIGWDCSNGNWLARDRFEVPASPIYLSLPELFAQIDEDEA